MRATVAALTHLYKNLSKVSATGHQLRLSLIFQGHLIGKGVMLFSVVSFDNIINYQGFYFDVSVDATRTDTDC